MTKKLTRRKAFKFYRSYYDVYNELSDKEKILFIEALLDRQFRGIKPKELKGMVRFAYLSQEHSIDLQVKGYEDATKIKLIPEKNPSIDPNIDPSVDPYEGGLEGPYIDPSMQEKEKEKEKEKGQVVDFDLLVKFYNNTFGRKTITISSKAKKQIKDRLKEGYTKIDLQNALINAKNDSYHIETNFKYISLEFISRPDKFERFSQNHIINVKPKMI
tara:strand:+ start:1668 stop:2315 length:648 start_codon:yes stop_codon:yes gene_type:complete